MQKLSDEPNKRTKMELGVNACQQSLESFRLFLLFEMPKRDRKGAGKQIFSLVEFKPNQISPLGQSKLVASRPLLRHYCA